MTAQYSNQVRFLIAVDCIIFGFDGEHLKLLLIQRGFEPEKGKWSLMGGFIEPGEALDGACARILHDLTGLEGVYLEQFATFGETDRDPIERTISVAHFALIDIHQYEQQLNDTFHAEWFPIKDIPDLIFDHKAMVEMAKRKLRYKAALHPILFELLPEKFTIPLLQSLFEEIYDTTLDKRNFSRKILSTGLLIKQADKDKVGSKKGAFFYKLDKRKYKESSQAFLNLLPNPDSFIF